MFTSLTSDGEHLEHTDVGVSSLVDTWLVLRDMTNGPAARIGEVLEVALPRPRERLTLASDPYYVRLRARVLAFLYDKQMRRAA